MKPQGCLAIVALVASGCVGSMGRGESAPTVVANGVYPSSTVPCGLRPEPPEPPALTKLDDPARVAPTPPAFAPSPPGPIETRPEDRTGPPADPGLSMDGPPPGPPEIAAETTAVPEVSPPSAAVVVEPGFVTNPRTEAESIPINRPAPVPTPTPSTASEKVEPPKPKGRPVASVGDEVISLPELTAVVKARIGQLGPGAAPNRRQLIALARSALKEMIVETLVFQEAGEKLGAEDLGVLRARFEQTWDDRERPALLRREGAANEAELRSTLARRLATPEALRAEFVARSVATEMIHRERLELDYDGYLDGLRKRRPIASIMSPAELMAAGRRAAGAGGVDR